MLFRLGLVVFFILTLTNCGSEPEVIEPAYDNGAEVQAFFEENPDRFIFAKTEDLRSDLNWQDGAGLDTFADPNAKRGGTLNVRLPSMQQTLRMLGPDANGSLRGPLWSANSINLIAIHPWSEGYIPGLAKAWAIDPDNNRKVYFELDPDARWSDGLPVTMEDIFFTAYFSLSPYLTEPAYNKAWDDFIESMTRYGDDILAITLKRASPEPLSTFTGFAVVQREFYREFGEDYVEKYHWRFPPVTGAYILDPDKVVKGQRITMDRIDNWWGDSKKFHKHRFNPDHLRFSLIRDDAKAFEAFLRGDFDWHSMTRTDLWYERGNDEPFAQGYIDKATVFDQLPAARDGLYINADDPLLNNRTLRLGVNHAINYELVNSALFREDRRRIRSFSDGYGGYSHPTLRARKYDIDLAQQYFAEAGFTTRGQDGVLTNGSGQRLSVVLTVANEANQLEVASILKTEAIRTGLEIIIDSLDRTAFFTKTFEKKFQMALHGWNTGYSKLPSYQWELRGEDAGKPSNFNTTNIKDEELDALIAEWDQVSDPVRAQQIAHGVQERVHEFAAWIPGLTFDYSRRGYWRWVQWPDYFNVPRYFFFMNSGVFWIDEDIQQATREAMENEETFPPQTLVYDRWKESN